LFDQETRTPQPTEDHRGVPDRHPQQPGSHINRERRVLTQQCVEPPGEMAQAFPSKEIVELVSELILDPAHERGPQREEFGRGAGVIKWL